MPRTAIPGATLATYVIAATTGADAGPYDCVITSGCGSVTTDAVTLTVWTADMGSQGGVPGADGVLDNNDFIVFINRFFEGAPSADIGRQGGVEGPDGLFDNNDFIVFINHFFSGC